MKKYTCPVCGHQGLDEPAYNQEGNGSHEICFCCGFEFGYDDQSEGITHEAYRKKWITEGAKWFDPDEKPEGWDLQDQLKNIS